MNQKTILIIVAAVIATLVLAPKLRSLPLVNKIPTV